MKGYQLLNGYFFWDCFRKIYFHIRKYLRIIAVRCMPIELIFLISSIRSRIYPVNFSEQIIVSLTTYGNRLLNARLAVKSVLLQKILPDKICLYLHTDEKKSSYGRWLNKYQQLSKGKLAVYWVDNDIKPHKKYFYCFSEFNQSIIITIDDDVIYTYDLISSLLNGYQHHPNCVIARRVNRLLFDYNGILLPYNQWEFESNKILDKPSHYLLATGVGGILYPPGDYRNQCLDLTLINKYSLFADDIHLKLFEMINNIPVVCIKSDVPHPYPLYTESEQSLSSLNIVSGNDEVLINLFNYFHLDLNFDTFQILE